MVDGQGGVQQGDNYGVININHSIPQQAKEDDAYKGKLDKLMEHLTFERMNARLHNVAAAFPKTCKWLFRHQSFLSWNNESKVHENNGLDQGQTWLRQIYYYEEHLGLGEKEVVRSVDDPELLLQRACAQQSCKVESRSLSIIGAPNAVRSILNFSCEIDSSDRTTNEQMSCGQKCVGNQQGFSSG